jgi:hypothetical protein
MNKWLWYCVASFLLSGLLSCLPAVAVEPDMLLKAKFVARFVQFTEWPPPPPSQFRYCVVGDTAFVEALQLTKLYSIQGEPLKIDSIDQPAQALSCQLLILSLNQHAELSVWQQQLELTPVLVITDNSEAFHSLAVIGLVTEPDGISFRINHTLAQQRGLKLSSQLLKLAREVQ